jgi:hypothetical protein
MALQLDAAHIAPDGTPLENVRLCPRYNTFDIDGNDTICASCVDEINEESADGRWVNTPHGWIYE